MKIHALALLLCLAACNRDAHPPEDHGDHGHGHDAAEDPRPGLVFTLWDAHTELFVEFPALVVGQESRFAAHLTRLSDFAAVNDGTMTAELSDGSDILRAVADAPSRPGIFRPTLTPTRPGSFHLVLRHDGLSATHDLGQITVYPNIDAAVAAAPPEADAGGVTFLKEQQWQIPFATQPVATRSLRPSLAVYATLRSRPDGEVSIHAPVAGRLGAGAGRFPQMGARITKDEVLAAIVPQLGQDSDRATLDRAVKPAFATAATAALGSPLQAEPKRSTARPTTTSIASAPSTRPSTFCTAFTQPPHVIPSIFSTIVVMVSCLPRVSLRSHVACQHASRATRRRASEMPKLPGNVARGSLFCSSSTPESGAPAVF